MSSDFINALVATFAALFPIANPIGNAAIFLSITQGEKERLRHQQALKGVLYMVGILVVFFFAGNFIMHFFGISLEGVRIAGGLIVAHVGFKMMTPKRSEVHSPEEEAEAQGKPDISLTPLAMPLLAGPGSIAVVLSMSSLHSHAFSPGMFGVLAGILITCAICFAFLHEADWIQKALGVNGTNALTRIMAFLLLCIGTQLVVDGVMELVKGLS